MLTKIITFFYSKKNSKKIYLKSHPLFLADPNLKLVR